MSLRLNPAWPLWLEAAFSIYLGGRGVRWRLKKYDFCPAPLDRMEQLILAVAIAATVAPELFEIIPPGTLAAALAFVSIAFAGWPPLAHYIACGLRRLKLIPRIVEAGPSA